MACVAAVPSVFLNGDAGEKVAGNLHIGFRGVESETLLLTLDAAGIYAAAGSSCSSGATEPSHVLEAMGLARADALASVRFSLGYASTDSDVDDRTRRHPARRRTPPRSVRGMSGARVLVAMSGGVDSSVAAALLLEAGHDVTGVTLKLWGGESDSGCCSVADVEDARRVAAQLGVPHYVFNFTEDFEADVVTPYVDAYAAGRTPNPCVECNRTMKFGRLLERAKALGFDAVATGHHARIVRTAAGRSGPGSRGRRRQGPVVRALHARVRTSSSGCGSRWVS